MRPTVVKASLGGAVALGLASVLLLQPGMAQTTASPATQVDNNEVVRSITVSGFGQVEVTPDQALVRLGVQTEAESAGDALSQNSERMEALLASLTDAGISRADIQTQNISLFPRYADPGPDAITRTQQLVGYTVSNIVQVRVRDLDTLGDLLDAAIAAGSNTIENIQFVVSDTSTRLDEARSEALVDARRKAQQLAEEVNGELGEVIMINESGLPVLPLGIAARADGFGGAAPVEPGTQTLSAQVQVTWRLIGGTGPDEGTTTATPTAVAAETETSTPFATSTELATETVVATDTAEATSIATGTATDIVTSTAFPTATETEEAEATETAFPTATETEEVETATVTVTSTPLATVTEAATGTATMTATP